MALESHPDRLVVRAAPRVPAWWSGAAAIPLLLVVGAGMALGDVGWSGASALFLGASVLLGWVTLFGGAWLAADSRPLELELDRHGLTWNGERVPRHSIDAIAVEGSRVILRRTGKRPLRSAPLRELDLEEVRVLCEAFEGLWDPGDEAEVPLRVREMIANRLQNGHSSTP